MQQSDQSKSLWWTERAAMQIEREYRAEKLEQLLLLSQVIKSHSAFVFHRVSIFFGIGLQIRVKYVNFHSTMT